MSLTERLRRAVALGALRDIDLHFARTLAEFPGADSPELLLAAALVSRATGDGHVCVELAALAGSAPLGAESGVEAPRLEPWRQALQASPVVGAPGEDMPLILDSADRLYLGRYWHFESTIAEHLRALTTSGAEASEAVGNRVADAAWLRQRLAHYFPARDAGPDQQKLAAAVALLNRFTVISGGPGTGKTTTVTRLLALLVETNAPRVPRIVLVAPTGKAAARLTESILQARQTLDCAPEVRAAISAEAGTLHRLLGWIPRQSGFRHHRANPLHLDILVVDEASMIDVPLMARLLEALPRHARLILLGDRDQLASVAAGSVLGDICNRGQPTNFSPPFRERLGALGVTLPEPSVTSAGSAMADSVVVLGRSYRFGDDSGIGNIARAINRGDAAEALAIGADTTFSDATWRDLSGEQLITAVGEQAVAAYAACLQAPDPASALEALGRFRFLCALRQGPQGVETVNGLVEQALQRAGLIKSAEGHYAGRPIMITRNDYSLRLFNGDIGVLWPDPEADGRLRAFFPDVEGGVRRVLPGRLPPHETVYAMTVHKSQGSEFDQCVVILSAEESPVITRELIYTAVTRARKRVELWGAAEPFTRFVQRRVERNSGLRDALWP